MYSALTYVRSAMHRINSRPTLVISDLFFYKQPTTNNQQQITRNTLCFSQGMSKSKKSQVSLV